MYVSALVAIAGILLAWVRYGRAPEADPDRKLLGRLWEVLHAKWYFDELYDHAFVRPLRNLGRLMFATDNVGVDGVIRLVVAVPRSLAFVLSYLQRGALQTYAASMVIGLVVLLLFWNWIT
jgi:NADH-quinone oxidoreductase subunit L